jgi:hypothetical protein
MPVAYFSGLLRIEAATIGNEVKENIKIHAFSREVVLRVLSIVPQDSQDSSGLGPYLAKVVDLGAYFDLLAAKAGDSQLLYHRLQQAQTWPKSMANIYFVKMTYEVMELLHNNSSSKGTAFNGFYMGLWPNTKTTDKDNPRVSHLCGQCTDAWQLHCHRSWKHIQHAQNTPKKHLAALLQRLGISANISCSSGNRKRHRTETKSIINMGDIHSEAFMVIGTGHYTGRCNGTNPILPRRGLMGMTSLVVFLS